MIKFTGGLYKIIQYYNQHHSFTCQNFQLKNLFYLSQSTFEFGIYQNYLPELFFTFSEIEN